MINFFKKDVDEDYKSVLHIWDFAGGPCLLAKYLRKNGYKSEVVMRKSHDFVGAAKYYGENVQDLDGRKFIKYAIKKAKDFGIIHINTLWSIIPQLRKKYPNKKIVLHHRGLELTRNLDNPFRKECEKKADLILCSAPYLVVEEHMKYIPNVIDTELFTPSSTPKNGKALLISIRYFDMELISSELKDFPYPIEIRDREKSPVPYMKMPDLLNQYSSFIDIRYCDGKQLEWYSNTALQALSCGLEVFTHNKELINKFPQGHNPVNVVKKLIGYYESL